MQLVFDDNFSSVRVIFSQSFGKKIVSRTKKISLKTILDIFFVTFYCTKNTRIDVFNNYTQRVINVLFISHGFSVAVGISTFAIVFGKIIPENILAKAKVNFAAKNKINYKYE